MDANEYALKVQPAPKSLGVLLNKAEWLGKGKRAEWSSRERASEPAARRGTAAAEREESAEIESSRLAIEEKIARRS